MDTSIQNTSHFFHNKHFFLFQKQVRNTKVVPNTLWILNNLNVNDNLHCRACRLIGNLSDCSFHAKAFFEAGAIQSLNDLLHTKANAQTYSMAIRAVRYYFNIFILLLVKNV